MMRRKVLTLVVAAAFLSAGVNVAAAQKVDFSGTWALDKERSEGLPPGMDQTMTVRHSGDRVEVDAKLSGPRGEQEVKDQFVLDGKEAEFTPPVLNGARAEKGKRTSKWSADGKGFDVSEEATIDGPDGPATVRATRRWQLSDDGKTLTVEMSFVGPQGSRNTKRVFARK